MLQSFLDCINFTENNRLDYFNDFTDGPWGFDPLQDFFDTSSQKDLLRAEASQEFTEIEHTKESVPVSTGKGGDLPKHEILEATNKLLIPSKKITKKTTKVEETTKNKRKNKRKSAEPVVNRQNAKKLSTFFKKWSDLRKKNAVLRDQIKLWFSSFNLKANKTYIYRDFFDAVRVHFRVILRDDCSINFQAMKEPNWQNLFVNLTEFLIKEVESNKETLLQRKKCQVYPVWIESLEQFTIGDLSTHTTEKIIPEVNEFY